MVTDTSTSIGVAPKGLPAFSPAQGSQSTQSEGKPASEPPKRYILEALEIRKRIIQTILSKKVGSK